MNEKGVTIFQETENNLVSEGKKRVGFVTSWEPRKTITVIYCINTAGTIISPIFIYPSKRRLITENVINTLNPTIYKKSRHKIAGLYTAVEKGVSGFTSTGIFSLNHQKLMTETL